MLRRPPHLLVTTPESLYLLVTAERSRERLRDVRTVIVDEIHAVARDKRGVAPGAHPRAAGGARPSSGPSASASRPRSGPIETIARLLVGAGEARSGPDGAPACRIVDLGPSPRSSTSPSSCPTASSRRSRPTSSGARSSTASRRTCSAHRTTLVFVNTRRLAERVAHLLARAPGRGPGGGPPRQPVEGAPAPPRGAAARGRPDGPGGDGLARARHRHRARRAGLPDRLAPQPRDLPAARRPLGPRAGRRRRRAGSIPPRATSSSSAPRSCAACAPGQLDRVLPPRAPLDILAQQIVAACAAEPGARTSSSTWCGAPRPTPSSPARTSTPWWSMLAEGIQTGRGRRARLPPPRPRQRRAARPARRAPRRPDLGRRDPRDRRLPGRRRSRRHHGRHRQRGLGHREHGRRRVPPRQHLVADPPRRGRASCAWSTPQGAPPTVPFWLGEAPARTAELSAEVSALREARGRAAGRRADVAGASRRGSRGEAGARRPASPTRDRRLPRGRRAAALGVLPTQQRRRLRALLRRGGRHAARVHAPFGGRINRALGLALRKRFCRRFDFELQAAASDDAVVLSLGPQQSFPLEDVPQLPHAANGARRRSPRRCCSRRCSRCAGAGTSAARSWCCASAAAGATRRRSSAWRPTT